jgi:hypothetical protein
MMALYATNIWDAPTGLSFEFNFDGGYLDPNHIKVESEHKTTLARNSLPFRLLNNYTVLLQEPVPADCRLWVYRNTPVNAPIVDFTNGSRVTEQNLDTSTQQAVFAVAELYDRIALGLGGAGFTAATTQTTTIATGGQTVFPSPTYTATDTILVFSDQLRIHPTDVVRSGSSSVTLPAQPAGATITVEVTRMLPIAAGGGGAVPPVSDVYGQNVGTGARLYKTKTGDALQFRTLVAGANVSITESANAVSISASGAGGSAPPVTTVLGNYTLNQGTPTDKIRIPTTDAGGWNTGVGMMTLDMEVTPRGYFASNPGGHVAMICRCDTGLLDSAVSGQGVIFGNMVGIGGTEGAPFARASQIETWEYPDNPSNRWIFPDTSGGPGAQMVDGQRYRFIIDTSKWYDGNRYIRYRRYVWYPAYSCWNLEIDTGSVLDHNTASDLTKTGVAFGHVFGSGGAGWSVDFNNVTVTWGPPALATDLRPILNRSGGTVTGPVTVDRTAIRMNAAGSDPTLWAKVLPAADNDDAKWFVAPSKESGQSLVIAGNSNTENVGYIAMAAGPTFASLNTSSLGSATPPELRMGYGDTPQLTFKSSGVFVGTRPQPLGNAPIYANLLNPGGTQARAFANSGSSFDIEALCAPGGLTSAMPATVTNSALEAALRPIYCLLSTLIKTTRDKGTA